MTRVKVIITSSVINIIKPFGKKSRFFRNDKKIIESVKEEFVARLIYENPTVILNEADKDYIEKRLQALLAGIIN